MLFSYSIPRALSSLSANWRASLNSMLIIAASLSVLGTGVLLYVNVIHFSRIWLSNTTVSLFLGGGIPAVHRDRIVTQVRDDPHVVRAWLVSPREGMEVLGAKLGSDHGLLAGVDIESLPYTVDFEVAAGDREHIHALAAKFIALDGVDEVVYGERALENVRLFFQIARGVGMFFIALILLSSFMIVSNAIRLSLHARQDEIGILAAVGATHGVIRSSFIIEGMLLSFAGFLLAIGIIWLGFQIIVAALSWNEATMIVKERAIFFSLDVLLVSMGASMLVGAVGSHVSVSGLLRRIEG